MSFVGAIASGLGEGRYYLSRARLRCPIHRAARVSPVPGTLNVRVGPEALRKLTLLGDWRGIRIDGFQASGRTFGGATCFPARMNGHPCHLIHPDRSHYKDVVEFVAALCLRETLPVKDLDTVAIDLEES